MATLLKKIYITVPFSTFTFTFTLIPISWGVSSKKVFFKNFLTGGNALTSVSP